VLRAAARLHGMGSDYGLAISICLACGCSVFGNSISRVQKGTTPVLFILVVGVAGWLYSLKIDGDKQQELSRRLIRPDEIAFTDAALGQTYGSWRVKGNVTNRSAHELSGFTLKIKVQDCPVSSDRCTTVGENEVTTYLSVPPNQMRAFEEFVYLRDMPQPKKLAWSYTVQEVRGKVK
jgi:hypothetical protein